MADNFKFIDKSSEADNMRLVKSASLLDQADDTYFLVKVPRFSLVTSIIVHLIDGSGYGLTSSITVGFDGNKETADPDAFLLNANIDPDGTSKLISLASSTGINKGGKWFDQANGVITLTQAIGDGGAGREVRLFVGYHKIYA